MPQLDLLPADEPISPAEEAEQKKWVEKLRLRLKDPEFLNTQDFPIGNDEAILSLSAPPYYTACPNPFLTEILEGWEQENKKEIGYKNQQSEYHRDPFASDVAEGKNDPIYNAHSYHTKVPHKAIMRYILHYTEPGDIVLDGFCGTGMTGVAAQLCGDKKTVESLGYGVDKDGNITLPVEKPLVEEKQKKKKASSATIHPSFSKLGSRRAILVDLSPAATFIAYNYNTPVNAHSFEREAKRILAEVEKECGWMYETLHSDGSSKGKINYTVWSDVFLCPACGKEMIFWDEVVDHEKGQVRDDWHCPACKTLLSKSPRKESRAQRAERSFETRYDRVLGKSVRMAKQVPVLMNYSVGKKRYDKRPDVPDLALIEKIENNDIPYLFPHHILPKGDKTSDPFNIGITHVHHFYTRRNLWVLAAIWNKADEMTQPKLHTMFLFLLSSAFRYLSRMSKLGTTYYFSRGGGVINAGISGTLFVPSFSAENCVLQTIKNRIPKVARVLSYQPGPQNYSFVSTQSSSVLSSNLASQVDYIFVDPPFGANLMYSELNFLWEAWLGIFTNNGPEAIINKTQRKGLPEYQALMESCFREFYRVLKPGRWMTVEFHNSQNAVWNSILEGLLRAGFMVADVRTLDKAQGSFNQVTTTGAVKQDLIISAYKPAAEFEQRFTTENGSPRGAWEFIRQHLEHLAPPALKTNQMVEFIEERAPYLLFDRMVAYHIQRGLSVPLSSPEFYAGLKEQFAERDGMVFSFPQAAEYDRLRLQAERVEQLPLFITDEKSAIIWLRRQLDSEQGEGPQTYSDLANKFKIELHQVTYEAMPELREILEDNFLHDQEERWYLPDPAKEEDLQALRERGLLREFSTYLIGKGRLKTFRLEAIRAGFSHAWKERDYPLIVEVANRIPARVFEDDPQLMMYADNARLRADAQPRQEPLL